MVRQIPQRPDHRETAAGKNVKQVTAKPKGIKPEMVEPKRSPSMKSILGQSGKRKNARGKKG